MKIVIIAEGKTERAFLPHLRKFLETRLAGKMPKLAIHAYDGRIPTEEKLKRVVQKLLNGKDTIDHVIALTDVYTGKNPPDFIDAADAKRKMRQWVGEEPRFHPHAAQFDFEAWLIPYWATIQNLAGHNQSVPASNPEKINHDNPPAYRIRDIFRKGKKREFYNKPRDAGRILRDNDLSISIAQCSELKAFINTILLISGGAVIP